MGSKQPGLTTGVVQAMILTTQPVDAQEEGATPTAVGSVAWFAWLEQATRFTFRDAVGHFTASKTRAGNRRGQGYWRASRRRHGRLANYYLGSSERLTPERLRQAAQALAASDGADEQDEQDEQGAGAQQDATPRRRGPRRASRVAPNPASAYPAVAELAPPTPLPQPLTALVGRSADRAALVTRLRHPEARLVTLTGPGGVGKTRLALAAAQDLAPDFADGVYWAPLAALSQPDFVLPAIAQALGLRETGWRPLLTDLQAALRSRSLLLLLDNLERLLDAAPLLAELLVACPQVKMLVTSRVALRLSGEYELTVEPLALPDPAPTSAVSAASAAPAPTTPEVLEAVLASPACALFVARAQAVRPELRLTAATAPLIAEICWRLDGLPLALELAAAASRLFAPQALLARLTGGLGQGLAPRLEMLTDGARDAPARHQTLRATIAWSEQLLAPTQQRLFHWLAVCAGGCTLESVEAMADSAGLSASDILAEASALVESHLLRRVGQPDADSEPRLLMLQTIREYGLERLASDGELDAARAAHAAYYLGLAETAAPQLHGAEQAGVVAQLAREQENLRAALDYLLAQAQAPASVPDGAHALEQALRLGAALYWFWHDRGAWREGLAYLDRALAYQAGQARWREEGQDGQAPRLRARALYAAAELASGLDETERAETLCEECLALSQEVGDTAGVADALHVLGMVARVRGQYALARSRLEEASGLFARLGVGWKQGACQMELARTATDQCQFERAHALLERHLLVRQQAGNQVEIHWLQYLYARLLVVEQADLDRAKRLVERSLAFFTERGYSTPRAYMLTLLAQLRLAQGELAQAQAWGEESLALTQAAGEREGMIEALLCLARVALAQGDLPTARRHFQVGLATLREMRSEAFLAAYLEGLAAFKTAQGMAREAARLWGAADALRASQGAPLPPVDRATDAHARARARAALGETTFRAAWSEGQRMTPAQAEKQSWHALSALAVAPIPLSTPSPLSQAPRRPGSSAPYELTARELEVLRWLAEGFSDAQIAEQLVISVRTVNRHTAALYSKLGVPSRAAATRVALEQRLLANPHANLTAARSAGEEGKIQRT
jgi:predicted ATPase/DNA-binding CsgD family transcriptional regulator